MTCILIADSYMAETLEHFIHLMEFWIVV